MPTTIKPALHKAFAQELHHVAESPEGLLDSACRKESVTCRELLQSSFGSGEEMPAKIIAARNGFVSAATRAYSQHCHLVLRPEDVWFSILTQLSFYVNAHAEDLRGQFVSFEGKKELTIVATGTRYTVDFGHLAHRMSHLLEQNIIDKNLREWIMPGFTTSTPQDEFVSSGERADWGKLMTKIEKLNTWGKEPTLFHDLLKPIIGYFIRSFDTPDAQDVKDFWNKIAHHESRGSGPNYYSGWISAFCFWDEDGKILYENSLTKSRKASGADDSLQKAEHRQGTQGQLKSPDDSERAPYDPEGHVVYENRIDTSDVPAGYTSVPVKLDDNGYLLMTTMIAGSVGHRVTISGGECEYRPTWRQDEAETEKD